MLSSGYQLFLNFHITTNIFMVLRITLNKTLCKNYYIKGTQHILSINYCVDKATFYWSSFQKSYNFSRPSAFSNETVLLGHIINVINISSFAGTFFTFKVRSKSLYLEKF